jgi:aquaporin-1
MATLINLFKNDTGCPDDMARPKMVLRDSLVEFMATTVFVYFGTLSAVSTGSYLVNEDISKDVARALPIALSFGVTISVMVYSIGHITGGHMNPGVSLLMRLRQQISLRKMACYWVCQFAGSLLGSALVWGSVSGLQVHEEVNRPPFNLGATTLNPSLSTGNGFLLELMGSFFFYFVISQTALDKGGIASSYFAPLAIGLSLVVTHIGLIPLTGCGVNPARTFGPSMVVCMAGNCSNVVQSSYWIYWVAPFLASFLVAELTHWLQMEVVEDENEMLIKQVETFEIDELVDSVPTEDDPAHFRARHENI